MKPELTFEKLNIKMSSLGTESSVPDLTGGLILQNNLDFHLDEEDEIYEGYGSRCNSYPYRQYNNYSRSLQERQVPAAILENDFLKAVFLPGLGGRLWSLTDKKTGTNLLYTNDVIRFSNLAVRNAWFSGGVEWNMGIIGHTPFTAEPLHTAALTDADGTPVLRMYEFERVRGVEYQMDFWLGRQDAFLNCRMRVVNTSRDVVPMYWWSNIAVPEYEQGRIVVPANEAYTCQGSVVSKVSIPYVKGNDITRYGTIPSQADYFFNIPKESPKYIANLNPDGYGLLQISTDRLQSRKLFSWGKNDGSDRWQEFLTEHGGRYLEIQAGLGKTQYGCIPMAPHTAWEWLEQYGPVQITSEEQELSFEELSSRMTARMAEEVKRRRLEQVLTRTKALAKTKGALISAGSPYGALKRLTRALEGESTLSAHLEYGDCPPIQLMWTEFMKTGLFPVHEPMDRPGDFACDRIIYERLLETICGQNQRNWSAHYHLGLLHFFYGHRADAVRELKDSLSLQETPWAFHALSSLLLLDGDQEGAGNAIVSGLSMLTEDLSYVKEGFRLLILSKKEQELLSLYQLLTPEFQQESRILFCCMKALLNLGKPREAYQLLTRQKDFVLEDVREGEDSLGEFYCLLCEKLEGKRPEAIPHQWNFSSIGY